MDGMLRVKGAALALSMLLCAALFGCGSPEAATKSSAVTAVDLPGAGKVLADGAGYTLYIYVPDDRGPSRCTSLCAQQWPPLLLPRGLLHPVAAKGVDAALLGTTPRANGSLQITYNDWPLYTYRNDGRGETTGQGEGMGAWYLLSVSGVVDRSPLRGTAA